MMIWYDHTWDWWGWLAMMVGMLVFWGLVIWGVVTLIRSSTGVKADPEHLLAERFARGELDDAEYQQRLDTLRTRRTPAARR